MELLSYLEVENNPLFIPSKTESIVSHVQVIESLEVLLGDNEITQYQFENLLAAIEISKPIYELEPRRDGFRNHANGHIYPAVSTLINDRGQVVEIVKDEISQIVDTVYLDGNLEQKSLYYSLLLMISHDWYEELDNQGKSVKDLRIFVKTTFGERVDEWIDMLTKPPKGTHESKTRNRLYYERLVNSDSTILALIKFHDRNTNHNDDYGIANPTKIVKYCGESLTYLRPWFDRILPEGISNYFGDMVYELMIDANESNILLDYADELRDRVDDVRSDGTTWKQHSERMEQMIEKFKLRKTVGFLTLIKLHDITEVDSDGNVVIKPEIELEEILQLMKYAPKKGLYALGLIFATKELELLMTKYLRNVDNSYEGMNKKSLNKMRELYSMKAFADKKEFGDRYGELEHIEPLIDESTMLEMLEWDIEALLALVLERLDNLENPVMRRNDYGELVPNAVYRWKTVQELLFLQPLLELGGFTDLASYTRGKAMEILYEKSDYYDETAEEFKRYSEFSRDFGDTLTACTLKATRNLRTVIRSSDKQFGNAVNKKEVAFLNDEGTESGDFVRKRIVYYDEGYPYNLNNVITFIENLRIELALSTGNENIQFEIINPRKEISNQGIIINSRREIVDENIRYIEQLEIVNPDLANRVELKSVNPNSYEYTQIYIKIHGIPGYEQGVFVEYQLVDRDSFERGIIGEAAHYIYKFKEKTKKAKKTKKSPDSRKIDKEDLKKIYLRMAKYRNSYRSHLYLAPKSIEAIRRKFPQYAHEFELDELVYEVALDEDENLRKFLLPQIC